ncbi:electron transport complex subunit RsxC [Desulfosarcina ovata]|uniref:Ion-translocating oxidoreductase complex subunit C n=1 Tax=Desulfosarcina ovata subsp. ovata TaxID=2752305 RepID=A0A5K8AI06_9BACT|nr:electron transport complex subunit RsxC [Desulfosarcina ovata]BBO92271.1 electron transport complex subunit C [Desulfosarcina ovata subsp. ovata]
MALKLEGYEGNGTFSHGIHPPERKSISKDAAIRVMPTPDTVVLSLHQNIGGPCEPLVKPRKKVAWGELIGKGKGFVSTTLHASIPGVVQRPIRVTLANGRHMDTMPIKAEGDIPTDQDLWDEIFGGEWPTTGLDAYDPAQISQDISAAGLVGMGGAAFPTHVKIMPNDKKPVHTLIVNGCECEPYLTSDYRLMMEAPEPIITGALLAARSLGAGRIAIGVEDNKMAAVETLKRVAAGTGIEIAVLKTKYPQGSEKHLIQSVIKRQVPLGGLPSDVGVAVSNVGTMAAVARAVIHKKPLTHRVISVTGGGIANPRNVLAPIGVSFGELIDFCGGLKSSAARLVAGGPMMGFAFTNPDTPVTKGTSGLTVMSREEVRAGEETHCVRCGKCVDVCPMRLVPTKIAMAARYQDIALSLRYNIMACFECGSCAYTCPAHIPLVQLIRSGKARIAAMDRK